MKKNIKTAAIIPGETIGIDVGDKMSHYAIVNQDGEVVEEGTFRNQASSIARQFGNTGRAWIARELKALGHEVIVANARETKWITASDQKNDRVDARKLALLAHGKVQLLSPVEHRTTEQQAEWSVIRARDALVRCRTLLVNLARSVAKGLGHRLPPTITKTFGKRALALIPETLKSALEGLLDQIDALGRAIDGYDQRIAAAAEGHPDFQERRPLYAQTAGAVRASHSGALGPRFGASAMGLVEKRRREIRDQTRHCRGRAQAGGFAAPPVGDRRGFQTLS